MELASGSHDLKDTAVLEVALMNKIYELARVHRYVIFGIVYHNHGVSGTAVTAGRLRFKGEVRRGLFLVVILPKECRIEFV
jgi:hypothetical protein